MRLQQMEVSCETKTKDNVFVLIRVAVQYQVNDDEESIKNAHYRLTNPKQQIESYVFDVVRSSVPKIDLDDVFTTKEEIAQNIKSELTSAMSSFGYTILASPITDIDPDKEVKRAMNDINKAKRLRLAAQDEGEAARTEIQAKADAEAKFLAGQGIARQRQAIMEGRARRSRRRRTRRPSSSRGRASRASGRPSWRGCASRSTPSRARCRTWTPRRSWTS